MATQQEKEYAIKGLGYSNPDELEIASYLKENPMPSPTFNTGEVNKFVTSYLSTQNAANTVNENVNKLNQISPTTAPGVVQKPTSYASSDTSPEAEAWRKSQGMTTKNVATPKTAKFVNTDGQIITYTEKDLENQDNIKKLKDEGYVFSEGEFVPNLNLSTKQNEYDVAESELDTVKQDFLNYNIEEDPEFAAKAASISSKFEKLRTQMKKTNESRAKAYSTAGMRGGAAEFAGDIQRGVEGEELNQANARLAEIDSQEQEAIAAARTAFQNNKYTEFSKKMLVLQDTRNEKAKALDDYNTLLADKLKEERESEIRSTRDSAIAGLMQQGITDPIELMDYLNFDESGKKIGDFTAKEISETMKAFADATGVKKENISADMGNFNYMKENDMLPPSITSLPKNEQYFAYRNLIDGKPIKGTGIGGTGTESVEEGIIRSRLFAKLMNVLNKGQVSDSDRKIIDERIAQFRDAGMGEQEIMDQLSGFATEVTTPYNNAFRNLIVQNTDNSGQQSDYMGKVSLLLNNGNEIGAMKTIESLSLQKAKQDDPDNYMGTATAQNFLTKIQRIREIMKEAGIVDTVGGPIEGTYQNLLGRFKGKEATKLKGEFVTLYAQFRKDLLGSAVTPSEEKFLEPLLASITDKKGNLMEKMNTFERNVLDRYNTTRSSAGLPTVTTGDVLDDNKRLKLYEEKLTYDTGVTENKTGILRSPDGKSEVSIEDLTPKQLKEAKDNGWK